VLASPQRAGKGSSAPAGVSHLVTRPRALYERQHTPTEV
jgi:hypothetical protein